MKKSNKQNTASTDALTAILAEFEKNRAQYQVVSTQVETLAHTLTESLVKVGCYGSHSRPRKYGITSLAQLVEGSNVEKLTQPYTRQEGVTFYKSLQQFSKAHSLKYPNKLSSIPEIIQGHAVLEFYDGYQMYLYYLSAEHLAMFASQITAITEAQTARNALSKAYRSSFTQVELVYLKMKEELYPSSSEW